jgi:adenylate cyclase
MEKDQLSRKLAVILHADVVGSTALVQKNETLAHQRIQTSFNKLSETIESYGGLTREIRGDALVAEFSRASDAVIAAIAFQGLNEASNASIDADFKARLRIGISMGEVIIADKTITGTGVVLAQRLEQLADSGGVVVQGSVSETVPTRMPFEFESLGEQLVKGFDQPVRAFSVSLKGGNVLPPPETGNASPADEHIDIQAPVKLSRDLYESLIGGKFELPNKPSIAILPFKNMSGDADQEHFSDGMTEDLITSLSRLSDLIVIASTSTFAYKGQAVDIRLIGRELGVRHVLEGSIRKSGDQLRITAQLIDAQSGDHVWAERYDRKLESLFEVQDEITHKIAFEMNVRLIRGKWSSRGTKNIKAWEYFVQAYPLLESFVREDVLAAKPLLEQAISLDNNYAEAWAMLGIMYWQESAWNWSLDPEQSMQAAIDASQKSLAADPQSPGGYELLATISMSLGDLEKAVAMGRKAYELAPGSSETMATLADLLIEAGQINDGLQLIKKAIRYSPFPPGWYLLALGVGLHLSGKNDEAIFALNLAIERQPGSHLPLLWLASALVELQRPDDARLIVDRVLEIEPEFSAVRWAERFYSETHAHLKDNLFTAGFTK